MIAESGLAYVARVARVSTKVREGNKTASEDKK